MSLRIFLAGGGSGGHVYPLVAVARELEKLAQGSGREIEFLLIGDKKGFVKKAAKELGRGYLGITAGKFRRYASLRNWVDFLKLPLSFIQAGWYLFAYMPDMVFSKGGYDALPVVFMARLFMIPVVIHESDAVPGLVNKWSARFAKKIFISFENAAKFFGDGEVELTGNPVRESVLGGDRARAMEYFKLAPNRPAVLFMGGSQGAGAINDIVMLSVVQLAPKFQIIHQCGEGNFDKVKSQANAIIQDGEGAYGDLVRQNYRLYSFFNQEEMKLAYAASDVIVSRAGAGSISEIAANGKAAIIVPLKGSASEHQLANAAEVAKYGAVVLEEDNLTTNILISELENLYIRRNEAAEQIKGFARPDAAPTIARRLIELLS